VIYVGIDDTDVLGSPGTNQLARHLIHHLPAEYEPVVAIRHQLLFDPRVPYTSKNSSASLLFRSPAPGSGSVEDLTSRLRGLMAEWFVEGSDPGLCVTEHVPEAITAFGVHCQREVVCQEDARRLAERHAIHLESLGGTEDGVIGALAAVGLAAGGDDGRVVQIGAWPDDLFGPQDLATLHARGVECVVGVQSNRAIDSGRIDVGKHLRPNYRSGKIVLFVEPVAPADADGAPWRAVRFT
jgi:hypothetical protein